MEVIKTRAETPGNPRRLKNGKLGKSAVTTSTSSSKRMESLYPRSDSSSTSQSSTRSEEMFHGSKSAELSNGKKVEAADARAQSSSAPSSSSILSNTYGTGLSKSSPTLPTNHIGNTKAKTSSYSNLPRSIPKRKKRTHRWPVIALLHEPYPKPSSEQELLTIILNPIEREYFHAFLESENCTEGLDFWVAADEFRWRVNQPDQRKSDVKRMADNIYQEHILISSVHAVNLPHDIKIRLDAAQAEMFAHADHFDDAMQAVFCYLNADPFRRFRASKYYEDLQLLKSSARKSSLVKHRGPVWSDLFSEPVLFRALATVLKNEYGFCSDLLFWAQIMNYSCNQFGSQPDRESAAKNIYARYLAPPCFEVDPEQLVLLTMKLSSDDLTPNLFEPIILKVESVLRNKFFANSFEITRHYMKGLYHLESFLPPLDSSHSKLIRKSSQKLEKFDKIEKSKLEKQFIVDKAPGSAKSTSSSSSSKKSKNDDPTIHSHFEDLLFDDVLFAAFERHCEVNGQGIKLRFWKEATQFACNLDLSAIERRSCAHSLCAFYLDNNLIQTDFNSKKITWSCLDPKSFETVRVLVEATLKTLWFTFVPI